MLSFFKYSINYKGNHSEFKKNIYPWCTSITHYMMGNMAVKLPCIRPYFSYNVLCY